MLYYIIVGAWEYLFFHTSPTHTAAAVKAKAANKDVSRRLAYETENFYPEKIKQKSKSRDETRRDVSRRSIRNGVREGIKACATKASVAALLSF